MLRLFVTAAMGVGLTAASRPGRETAEPGRTTSTQSARQICPSRLDVERRARGELRRRQSGLRLPTDTVETRTRSVGLWRQLREGLALVGTESGEPEANVSTRLKNEVPLIINARPSRQRVQPVHDLKKTTGPSWCRPYGASRNTIQQQGSALGLVLLHSDKDVLARAMKLETLPHSWNSSPGSL